MEFKGGFACPAEVAISVKLLVEAHAQAPASSLGATEQFRGPASADDSNWLSDSRGRERSSACAQLFRPLGQKEPTKRQNLANSPLQGVPMRRNFWAVALVAIASAALPWNARANVVTSGNSITVDSNAPNPWTSTIGSGPSTASGTTVTLLPNAQVVVGDANGISLAD